MLRSNQEEQIKYFYLDRKFGSGNLRQIGDALDEIDLFLPKMKKIDLINSLVMRMLDLIQTAKSFHIKQHVSIIFRHHSQILLSIHSKDEIAAVLSKCLKGSDQYTRIIATHMITTLSPLFLKDIAVYHTLLSKIASPINSKQQKKEAIICLTELLSNSTQLSKIFTKNITSIQLQYQIQLHVLIYLLTYVTVDSHLQRQILQDILRMIKNVKESIKNNKKQIYYYEKLVVKYAASNYRIVGLYESKLHQILPKIQKSIREVKSIKYPFMKNVIFHNNETHKMKIQNFIDELYQMKRQGYLLTQYQTQIKRRLTEAINTPSLLMERLLLIYYLEQDCSKIDNQVSSIIQLSKINSNKSLLKKLLVIGLFQSSRLIINRISLKQSNYIFLKLYIEFKIEDSKESFQQLLQIAQILNKKLFKLLNLWSKINQILQIKTNNTEKLRDLSPFYHESSEIYLKLKQQTSFKSQLQLISHILHYENGTFCEIKSKCNYLLPNSILNNNSQFWFAYLHKQTILQLFNTEI